jgi:serine/threonine protein kinase
MANVLSRKKLWHVRISLFRIIQELMSAVEEKDIIFLDHLNNVSKATKDLLLRMLTKDPQKRITWKELFEKELVGIDCFWLFLIFL